MQPDTNASPVLTLGMFDGVHRGHQMVIDEVIRTAKSLSLPSLLVTFTQHPSQTLTPHTPKLLITTLAHRLKLLQGCGLDFIKMIPFTKEVASQSAEDFLAPFHPKVLLLGHDAKIGRDRQGGPSELETLSKQKGFSLHYLPPLLSDGAPISSSRIRAAILTGNLEEAARLLGRPYSIYGPLVKGAGLAQKIGFPTLNLRPEGIVLPPLGVWSVEIDGQKAIANLGHAPTFDRTGPPLLEVHVLNHAPLPQDNLEVIFKKYLRPEVKFASTEALKQQIQKDIEKIQNNW